MTLDVKQQALVLEAGRLGMRLSDALIHAGLSTADAERLLQDPVARDAFDRGRVEGLQKVRGVMMLAAESGNVSAAKVLGTYKSIDDDGDDARVVDTRSDAERRRENRRIYEHVKWLFERQRRIFDGIDILGTEYERDPY